MSVRCSLVVCEMLSGCLRGVRSNVHGQSGGIGEGRGLQVVHVAPQLLWRCSKGPLLGSCFSEVEGGEVGRKAAELENLLWGL